MKVIDDIRSERPTTLFVKHGIPGMVGMAVLGAYMVIDAVYVGRLVGNEALAAVGLASVVTLLNQAFMMTIGTGAGALLSIALGKGDLALRDRLLTFTAMVSVAFGLLAALLTGLFARTFLSLLGASGPVLELGTTYLRVLAIGMPFISAATSLNICMRSSGLIRRAMTIVVLSTLINLFAAPALIRAGSLGIAGAGWATVLAQVGYLVMQVYAMRRAGIAPRPGAVDRTLVPGILKNGAPQGILQIMMLLQHALLFGAMARVGAADQLALLTLSFRVYLLLYFLMWGVAHGMQSNLGVNFGARQYGRVVEIHRTFSAIGTVMVGAVWVIAMIWPGAIIGVFVSGDLVASAESHTLFRIFGSTLFLAAMMMTNFVFFVAIDRGSVTSVLVLCRQLAFFVPILLLAPRWFGVHALWAAVPVSDLLVLALGWALVTRERRSLLGAPPLPELQPS